MWEGGEFLFLRIDVGHEWAEMFDFISPNPFGSACGPGGGAAISSLAVAFIFVSVQISLCLARVLACLFLSLPLGMGAWPPRSCQGRMSHNNSNEIRGGEDEVDQMRFIRAVLGWCGWRDVWWKCPQGLCCIHPYIPMCLCQLVLTDVLIAPDTRGTWMRWAFPQILNRCRSNMVITSSVSLRKTTQT
ncbi:hypothetical protein QBC38DRAFT_147442 [Podospora fimiseda]|uniref:Uncharacterized protein n=1 Tax=Podospora fimiseda TaxID=252190 RepID=A0AAN7BYV7_9PEZI|nr:hypothetical protein QBC38DRAFT_147442 [Podospora fimiseda]